ncbi:hypothetical protein NDU88_003830 [Pleurodeles waltl]|uniref:Uncharacterized protein n=1 Tax=Pleurodeles waltl TaxID=8319 RepID=A0AAV7QAU5_PLEWA|nr:hypothetical protein NDU88_003830 [Pleurodeles waltl]
MTLTSKSSSSGLGLIEREAPEHCHEVLRSNGASIHELAGPDSEGLALHCRARQHEARGPVGLRRVLKAVSHTLAAFASPLEV